jgi:8-oxo-dGTP diphosphatase
MQLLDGADQPYHRIPNHFTASAVVIALNHILLVHHRRIQAWLPPGGHIGDMEMPHEAAVRETFEETGVNVEVISEPMPQTGKKDCLFLPQPLCLHAVTAIEKDLSLYHLDLSYLAKPLPIAETLPTIITTDEVHAARWVELGRLGELKLANNVVEVVKLAAAKLKLPNYS